MQDTYKTISSSAFGEFRDRASKFLAYAFPLKEEADISDHLTAVKKQHPKARHHCYAWRLGLDGNRFRANDDGEPSGTAGRPILGQLDRLELTNLIVIVVRYFGGTKLGTSGLINAYKTATATALEEAEVLEKHLENVYSLEFDYSLMSEVMNAVKNHGASIIKQEFTDKGLIHIGIKKSEAEDTLCKIRAQVAGVFLEEEDKWQSIDGLAVEFEYTF